MPNSKIVQGHQARKRFGQNFLSDNHYIDKIITSIAPQKDDHIVEIGPGLGAITEHLVEQAGSLDVVELDRDLIPRLQERFAQQDNFSIHQSDALKFDFTQLKTSNEKLRIVGNLPYNISTPLIFHLLDQRHVIHDMYFMLQKEVVERLCAAPCSKQYGRLSVMTQYFCQTAMLFVVPPGAFSPAPKVDSAIVRLKPHDSIANPVQDTKLLSQIVTAAFNQRRKTIRNSLKDWLSADDFATIGLNATERAERLSLQDFITICHYLENQKP
ncbi:16S rRNA (adenine(1518)-N(6)/adenine(1519)-N(6))-dimethyltransferase RsmA [Kangiella marina]|uniref:Ribosomal RNA small subunit methyltransferase A n=1 Tax=Kangiella marina TaxID=1079178 RepID=A0ABP8IGU2_9GAMM